MQTFLINDIPLPGNHFSLKHKGGAGKAGSESVYKSLIEAGVEVLLDDRDERVGAMFKDADLMGIPVRIIVGAKALKEGNVELKLRKSSDVSLIKLADMAEKVKEILAG